MDIVFSLVYGISIKLYDDLIDNKIINDEFQIELLKGLQLVSLTAISIRDFNFSLFFILMNLLSLCADVKSYTDNTFYISLAVISPIILVSSFSYRTPVNFVSILYVCCFLSFFALEPHLIKEEYSHRKFIIRILTSIVVFVGLFVGKYFNVSWSFLKIGITCLAYIFTSSVFQLYMLSQSNDIVLQTMVLRT